MSNPLTFFTSGIAFGLLAGYGLPSEGNLLLLIWDVISKPLKYYFAPEHGSSIFVVGVIILLVATILILWPVIVAALEGVEGFTIFIAGLLCGLLFTSFVKIQIFVICLLVLLVIIHFLRK